MSNLRESGSGLNYFLLGKLPSNFPRVKILVGKVSPLSPVHSGPDRPENRRLINGVASYRKNVYYGVALCTEFNFEALRDVRFTG